MGREPWTSRLTVEECPIHLSAAEFNRSGVFRLPDGTSFDRFLASVERFEPWKSAG